MITQEAINQHLANIDEYYAAGDYAAIFREAKVLYDGTDGTYPYFLGACYLNAWGTQCDYYWAAKYLEEAAKHKDNYDYACHLAGLAYYRKAEYPQAIEWLAKAEEAGVNDAIVFLADAAAAAALNLWPKVSNYIIPAEFAQGVEIVKQYIAIAMDKYEKAALTTPQLMSNAFWCGFGNMGILLYHLSTRGCLNIEDNQNSLFSSMVSAGFQMLGSQWDHEAHRNIYQIGVTICDFMADNGAELVSEYFRAFLSLLESERHNSAEAFYRARWHMKRIGELRKEVDPQAAEEVAGYLKDVDIKYQLQNRKYGSMVISMMRSGRLPDISVSYGEGRVPAVESCENFMNMFNEEQAMAAQAQASAAQTKGNSITGFLKNIFKI